MDESERCKCLGHSNWTICTPLSPFCSGNFQFGSPLYWEVRRAKVQLQNWMSQGSMSNWGIQIWSFAALSAHFVLAIFNLFHLYTGRPILITPEGLIVRKGKCATPELNETEGVECLGHSNWTICSPLSPFCSGNFQFVSSLYWEANSYYPRGLIVRKGSFSNSKTEWDRGVWMSGAIKLDHLQPFQPILF